MFTIRVDRLILGVVAFSINVHLSSVSPFFMVSTADDDDEDDDEKNQNQQNTCKCEAMRGEHRLIFNNQKCVL